MVDVAVREDRGVEPAGRPARGSSRARALAWKTPLVSTTTSPSSVSTTAELANASTNATPGCTSASCPLDANGWWASIGSSPVNSLSARSSRSRGVGHGGAVSHRRRALPREWKRVSIPR